MSTLTCSEFDSLRIAQTAERDDADTRLAAHAASCSRCAAVWSEERALDAAIALWKAAVPDAELAERVLARWRQEREAVPAETAQRERRHSRSPAAGKGRYALLAVAAVATILLAVSLMGPHPRRPGRDVVTTPRDPAAGAVAAKSGGTADTTPEDARELQVDQLVAGMRTKYSRAARGMTRMVDGWKFPSWPAIADVEFDLIPKAGTAAARKPVRPRNQTRGDWSDGLKPIGRDVRKAFSFLRDAVPGLDGSST